VHIVVGSHNPVKLNAVKRAFQQVFPQEMLNVMACTAPSGVSDQPMSDAETLKGAQNRAFHCANEYPDACYWVGLEGGCQMVGNELEAFAWMFVKTSQGEGKARTASFGLPQQIARLVAEGMELGAADDLVFRQNNSKQQGGAVGLLTGGLIDRSQYYEQALILSLIPFINTEFY